MEEAMIGGGGWGLVGHDGLLFSGGRWVGWI